MTLQLSCISTQALSAEHCMSRSQSLLVAAQLGAHCMSFMQRRAACSRVLIYMPTACGLQCTIRTRGTLSRQAMPAWHQADRPSSCIGTSDIFPDCPLHAHACARLKQHPGLHLKLVLDQSRPTKRRTPVDEGSYHMRLRLSVTSGSTCDQGACFSELSMLFRAHEHLCSVSH
jgi:hypothetical protein